MKLVVKFGGTSLATVKDIKNVVKTVDKIAKKNKMFVKNQPADNNPKHCKTAADETQPAGIQH